MKEIYPKVTVAVPCYNHAQFIEQCLLSILNQTYPNIELLVTDDGSSDNSPELIRRLSDKHGFQCYFHANRGLSATLNTMIAKATGKYLCIIASDDYWASDKVSAQIMVMESRRDVKICFTNNYMVDDKNRIINKAKIYKKEMCFTDVLIYGHLPPASLMARMQDIRGIGVLDEGIVTEDLYLWLKLLESGGVSFCIDEPLVYYRRHGNNYSKNTLKIVNGHNDVLDHFRNNKLVNWQAVDTEWALKNFYKLITIDRHESFKYLPKAIRKPWDIRLYKGIVKLILGYI